jgi:hypothetical protein
VLVVHKAALATTHLSDPKKYPMDETIPAERLVAAMEQVFFFLRILIHCSLLNEIMMILILI